MKLLTIKIEKSSLQLAEVNQVGKKSLIQKMRMFALPENLENGGFIHNPSALADFILSCIERGKLTKEKSVLLMDVASVMLKEYTHEKTKPSALLALASLEAEAVLPENEGSFIIENEWYGGTLNKDGLQRSAIYAVNEAFITEISKELKVKGVKLTAVFPTSIVHTQLIRNLLSAGISGNEFNSKTVAAIDLSHQEIRVSIFHNRSLIHQRADDILMEEFYRSIAAVFMIPLEEAEEYCLKYGFLENGAATGRISTEIYESIQNAGAALITKLFRSINIILTSEQLHLDQIIISGTAAAFPGIAAIISEYTGAPCSSIDDYYGMLSQVVSLDGELKERQNLYQRLVILAGVDYRQKKSLNFLMKGIARKRSNRRTLTICGVIFLVTILIMAVLPLNYYITSQDYKDNSKAISSKEYVAARALLEEQRRVQTQLQEKKAESDSLPFGQSDVAAMLKELKTKLFTGSTINSLAYDQQTETFSMVFTTSKLDDFVVAKNRLNEGGRFKVSLPLTVNSTENMWQCQITIKVLPKAKGQEE